MIKKLHGLRMWGRQGFTFVEMLFVLAVISLLLSILPLQHPSIWSKQWETQAFFNQLVHQIQFAQEVALLEKEAVSVSFQKNGQNVFFRCPRTNTYYEFMDLPEHLQIVHAQTFHFYRSGHISQFDTVYFDDLVTGSRYALVFQLGSGQFEVVQHA